MRDQLVKQDMLRGRKRLGPVGWILVLIAGVFVAAIGFGFYRQVTRNVSELALAATPTTTAASPAVPTGGNEQAPTVAPVALGSPSPASIQDSTATPLANTQGITWTVQLTKDDLGKDVYKAPPKVEQAVLRDYLAAFQWWNDHMFDPAYLRAHAADYYSGKALNETLVAVDWVESNRTALTFGEGKLLPLGRLVRFFPSGTQAFIASYIAAGESSRFNLASRERQPGWAHPDVMNVDEVSFDPSAKRWKISRNVRMVDLSTMKVIWGEEDK